MKLWAVLGILVAGLMFGCATDEPNTSGVLSLDRNRGEAPEGVTIQDVDIIKDGFIDIKDLFAVVHFYEQEVPEADEADEADAVAAASDTDDESVPCRNLESRLPEMEHVTDNSKYRQIFELEGKKYVYALLGLQKTAMTVFIGNTEKKNLFPSCVAVRFLLNDSLIPTRVKIKPVVSNDFSEPITSPLLESYKVTHPASWGEHTHYLHYHSFKLRDGGNKHSTPLWSIYVHKDFDPNHISDLRTRAEGRGKLMAPDKVGIPIGDNGVIVKFQVKLTTTNFTATQKWEIQSLSPITQYNFSDPFYSDDPNEVDGVYINMSPTEVRQRYFPEDL